MEDVTIILSVYKRVYSFEEQYAAIKRQTYPNISTVIWINKADNVNVPEAILNNKESVYSETNHGVWGRFKLAQNYKSKYICIIDDDTIPGSKWIENCVNTIKEYPGVITTRGVVANYGFDHLYPLPASYNAYGWANPQNSVTQVDMGCHSWFFESKLLEDFWAYAPEQPPMNYGEDMHLSYVAQKNNLGTYVAPHPLDDMEMWGSNPEKGHTYGSDENAISWDLEASRGMNKYWNYLRSHNFTILSET